MRKNKIYYLLFFLFLINLFTPAKANRTLDGAPLLDVENADNFPAKDHLVFSKVVAPWSGGGVTNANHDKINLKIWNKGSDPLNISGLTISDETIFKIVSINGADPGEFILPHQLNSLQFINVLIEFIDDSNRGRVAVLHETLTINSNDPENTEKKVFLHGLLQRQGEGKNEPTAMEIIDAFGFKTDVGFVPTDPDKGDPAKLKGNEVLSPYFKKADNTKPVYVRQMAAYHSCCNATETLRYHALGNTTPSDIFKHRKEDGQSLLPRLNGSEAPAEKSFNPTSESFGFIISKDFTDYSLNVHPGYPNDDNKIGIRVWKAIDANGNIIPNAYILANDYLGGPYTNYDYNDNVYFVSNIKPHEGTAHYSELGSTPSALEFGSTSIGAPLSLKLKLENLGKIYSSGSNDPSLTISSIEIVGENSSEFSNSAVQTSNLGPEASTTIDVQFNPTSHGLKLATLLIHYNNNLSPLRVPLYGIALEGCNTFKEHYRIKSGVSSNISVNNKTWVADKAFRSGNVQEDKPNVKSINATDDDAVYINYLSSTSDLNVIKYAFPVSNGNYIVRLHFSENYFTVPGSRVFTVKMEGEVKLQNFDILKEVPPRTALIKHIPVSVTDDILNMEFIPTVNRLSLAGVEIISFESKEEISVSTEVIKSTCNEANGAIKVNVPNSGQEFSFKLGPNGTYQTSGNFTNLFAGTYLLYAKSNSCESSFEIKIEDDGCPNQKPEVAHPIANQTAKEGSPFSFTLLANTFIDQDQDDELTYTVKLTSNENLPAWLSFNSETRTFNGTPSSSNVGTLNIKVTATDKAGAAASDEFSIVISDKNDPYIEAIEDQTIVVNTTMGPLAFSLSPGDQSLASLTLSATSSNQDLIPNSNISLGGAEESRTITATPIEGMTGSTTIGIVLKGNNTEITRNFIITVVSNNEAPVISEIEDVSILTNTASDPILFSVSDAGNEENLIITSKSDDQQLIPNSNIVISGEGKERTIVITPQNNKTGATKITIQVSDGELNSETSFNVTVLPVTSIDTEKVKSTIRLYPNPSTKELTVEMENEEIGTMSIYILDTKGKHLATYMLDKKNKLMNHEINVDLLSAGTYIIKIVQKNSIHFKKFIKR